MRWDNVKAVESRKGFSGEIFSLIQINTFLNAFAVRGLNIRKPQLQMSANAGSLLLLKCLSAARRGGIRPRTSRAGAYLGLREGWLLSRAGSRGRGAWERGDAGGSSALLKPYKGF